MNGQSENDPNEQREKQDNWLRPLHQRLTRELLQVISHQESIIAGCNER
ncbi:MAG: hypothetical protein RI563_09060 [Thiohalophilus sp.]|nr:hypothetical protein [Thiohalophilus sp.]MDR9437020.1 hypothetical protein [Thiohalophilus sp.]